MRSYKERKQILNLHEKGLNKSQISKATSIPRGTVRDVIKKYNGAVSKLAEEAVSNTAGVYAPCGFDSHQRHQYSYLLGMYFGDGCVNKEPRCHKIRISLDTKYKKVIEHVKDSLQVVFPKNKVGTVRRKHQNCIEVYCYSQAIPFIIPQWDGGIKHQRKITLKKWQRKIIEEFPWAFLKGLLDSDGSRDLNVVNGKEYPRYQFSNKSKDIQRFFRYICKHVGVGYTVAHQGEITSIAKRKDVDLLDKKIGGKQ